MGESQNSKQSKTLALADWAATVAATTANHFFCLLLCGGVIRIV